MDEEMLLLGAGASVEAGVPNAMQMAEKIIEKFNADPGRADQADVLNFVNERLIDDARRKKGDPTIDRVDVEALYNALLMLSEREALDISPFVGSWLPELGRFRGLDELLGKIRLRMELMLEDLTLIKDERSVEYLKPILNLVKRQTRLTIATLNYDNAIELLSRANGVDCETGIVSWTQKGVFDYTKDGIRLVKLHGSNYWFWTEGTRTYDERLPHRQISAKSHFEDKLRMTVQVETPMVIFGHRNKLTAEGPFLDLLKQFDEGLRRADTLTVIGYSFRDPHINFYITKFLNQYRGKIIVVSPGFDTSDVPYVQDLREFQQARPGQIDVRRETSGDALKGLYP
jgi:hypothetical protein